MSACVVLASAVAAVSTGAAAAATPTVTPATGGAGAPFLISTTVFDLADVGYESSEFILSGTASAYTSAAPLTADGKWSVTEGETAPYTTRIVVYRPQDDEDFNGTVVVEWLNVSGGVDANPDWMQMHTQMIRDGYAWVGVSAQEVGLNSTKGSDPDRYALLSHPGDSFAYDMFSQAGQAVRDDSAVLGGLTPKRVLAVGESQSAFRLVTYIDGVHPVAGVYDGFLVHSRLSGAASLSQAPLADIPGPESAAIRADLDAPVFVYQTETDVSFSDLRARQPDTKRYRLWEAPGTSHYDTYGLEIGTNDVGDGAAAVAGLAAMQDPSTEPVPGVITCNLPINAGPMHYHLNAALHHLDRWVARGTLPPKAPRLETTGVAPVAFAVDDSGNAKGGVRSPHVDAPIATLGGVANSGDGEFGVFCFLFGTTEPFTDAQLAARYPSHRRFVARWNKAVERAVKAGYLLPADAAELEAAAAQSQIGG